MYNNYIISTVNQKVLSLLVKFHDMEFHERGIARKIGISYGAANKALKELYISGAIKRRREGKMYFCSADTSNPIMKHYKILVNILLVEPLVKKLHDVASKIVLYGSCAQGTDTAQSDMDLYIMTIHKDKVMRIINDFEFEKGFNNISIQPVIKNPGELLSISESTHVFMTEVEQGINLWERSINESRL